MKTVNPMFDALFALDSIANAIDCAGISENDSGERVYTISADSMDMLKRDLFHAMKTINKEAAAFVMREAAPSISELREALHNARH